MLPLDAIERILWTVQVTPPMAPSLGKLANELLEEAQRAIEYLRAQGTWPQ